MDKQKQIEKVKGRLRRNGEYALCSSKARVGGKNEQG